MRKLWGLGSTAVGVRFCFAVPWQQRSVCILRSSPEGPLQCGQGELTGLVSLPHLPLLSPSSVCQLLSAAHAQTHTQPPLRAHSYGQVFVPSWDLEHSVKVHIPSVQAPSWAPRGTELSISKQIPHQKSKGVFSGECELSKRKDLRIRS